MTIQEAMDKAGIGGLIRRTEANYQRVVPESGRCIFLNSEEIHATDWEVVSVIERYWDGFMVFRRGAREPEAQYDKFSDATDEMRRLAKLHPGAKYYVLEVLTETKD